MQHSRDRVYALVASALILASVVLTELDALLTR